MSRATQDATACREALARLPELDLGELRQQWRALYKADARPRRHRGRLAPPSPPGLRHDIADDRRTRWYRILSHALVKYLKGRQLDPPRRLQAA